MIHLSYTLYISYIGSFSLANTGGCSRYMNELKTQIMVFMEQT